MILESNGKRTEVHFSGTLLVPADELPGSYNFLWVGTLQSSDNRVEIIVFKTSKKEDYEPLMQADLKMLCDLEPSYNVLQQISFIERMLEEIHTPEFIKVPEQSLLDTAACLVKDSFCKCGVYVMPHFTRENTIYTSAISAMYNN